MTRTPWGNATELRSRKLPPGPGASPEVVARNQRERLLAAMVATVSEHGYAATRVADLVELSGVSRSAFYQHFEDKLDCFLATLDGITAAAAELVSRAYARGETWEEGLRAAAEKSFELVLDQPAAARLCLVEAYAAGPQALERLDRATASVERAVARALARSPERSGMPAAMVHAIVGGLRRTIHTRLRLGQERDLIELGPQLLDWALSYQAPPQPLRQPRARPRRSDAPVPIADSAVDRLLAGTVLTAAERGYPAMTIAEMAGRASASLGTFYASFASKEVAFVAAVEHASGRAVDAAMPAFERASDWPHGVRDGLDAFFGFLAAEPATAKVLAVETYAAGFQALQRGDRMIGALHEAMQRSPTPATVPVTPEAIGGAIHALAYSHVRRQRTERMRELTPLATFIALSPFIGATAACAVANEAQPRR